MIALDANGADGGPRVVAEGALRAAADVLTFGPAIELDGLASVVDAPRFVANDEHPLEGLRARPDASIAQAARAVAEGRAEALVSAGHTGATLAASLEHLGLLEGVERAALAVLLPGATGPSTLLLDAGAGLRANGPQLVGFAHLGVAFMSSVAGVDRPRVALLSVGAETGKGTPEVLAAAHELARSPLRFVGNVEGGDLLAGSADVVVCDGFTGNVALKAIEGAARLALGGVRDALASGTRARLGGLLVRPALRRLARRVDPNAHGGAILLGLRRPVVVAHGASSADGVAAAIALARRAVDERMVERTAAALAAGVQSVSVASFAPGFARGSRISS